MVDQLKSARIFRAIKFFIITLFFIGIFLALLRVALWDYDFWWHVATGRYIVSTGSLPDKDPFSYTSTLEENKNKFPERENFILKQYWLSQVIFYLIYDNADAKGIILLRTILLVATLLLVFWRLQRWSVSFPVSFIFVFTLFSLLTSSTGERPVLFTIFFTVLTFFILEDFKDKKDKRIFLLIPIMLLWSNMHGGFILGVAVIMVFILGEGIKIILRKTVYSGREISLFYAATIIALAFSFINPTGWDAFSIAFSSKYKPFTQGIQEYASPFFLYKEKVYPVNYWYISLVALFPALIIIRKRKIDLTHIILLSGLLMMSLSAIRFIVYYGLIASMIIGKELDIFIKEILRTRFSEEAYEKMLNVLTIVAILSVILYISGIHKFEKFRFGIAKGRSVPAAAVDFIEENRLSGNMFNDYGYGGYLAWRLYPQHKTFIDSRGLNIGVMTEFSWITQTVGYTDFSGGIDASIATTPLWERLINHYDINFMLLAPFDIYAQLQPLIFQLIESDKWVPVYCDFISIIFVRNVDQNGSIIKKSRLSKEVIYNRIAVRGIDYALFNKVNPRSLISIGDTFYKMGRLEDALTAYQYALKRMPNNPMIQEKINQVEAEIAINNK